MTAFHCYHSVYPAQCTSSSLQEITIIWYCLTNSITRSINMICMMDILHWLQISIFFISWYYYSINYMHLLVSYVSYSLCGMPVVLIVGVVCRSHLVVYFPITVCAVLYVRLFLVIITWHCWFCSYWTVSSAWTLRVVLYFNFFLAPTN